VDRKRPRGDASRVWADAWFAIISLSALLSVVAVALDWPPPLRPALTTWFVVICPGMAIVRLLALPSLLIEVTLAIAVSLALAGLFASALVYAGAWSPALVLELLVVTAVGALVLGLARRRGPVERE
jgi:hypothetical protein